MYQVISKFVCQHHFYELPSLVFKIAKCLDEISRDETLATLNSISKLNQTKNLTDTEAMVEKIFSKMDTDGNGTLSKEEFICGAKLDSTVIEALSLCDRCPEAAPKVKKPKVKKTVRFAELNRDSVSPRRLKRIRKPPERF